jgi:hypothetical protein
VRAPVGAKVSVVLDTPDLLRRPGGGARASRSSTVPLARSKFRGTPRTRRPQLRLGPRARRRLSASRGPLSARVLVSAQLPDGRHLVAVQPLRVIP